MKFWISPTNRPKLPARNIDDIFNSGFEYRIDAICYQQIKVDQKMSDTVNVYPQAKNRMCRDYKQKLSA
jgi:hypothetical protein